MLLREALQRGLKTLAEGDIPSPQWAAELLLMHAVGCSRSDLHAYPERQLSSEVIGRYGQLISERLAGKPTQYITGHQEFWGLDFEVTPDVLIPRPETERLVEVVLELMRPAKRPEGSTAAGLRPVAAAAEQTGGQGASVTGVDVGTGSGCIALALASELPEVRWLAVDISAAALRVAQRNAARLNLATQVQFRLSDLLSIFLEEDQVFDFVVSNPPYVRSDELDKVQREVREFEPRVAWGGLEDHDEIYRRLFRQAARLLKRGGYVVVEIGYSMGEAVAGLLGEGWTGIRVQPDLNGIPRVVMAQKPSCAAKRDGKLQL